MFFINKYAPKNTSEIIFHKDEVKLLKKMSDDNSIPHIIFYGPEGAGKKTLIKAFLAMLYDDRVNKLCDSTYKVTGSGNSTTDVVIKQSDYHIVIEPNNNNFDRYLIQDVVKEYAKKMPLNVFTSNKSFKSVLINNVDNLSYYAQTSLRRTMEKNSETCRFIMWCRSLSRVIDPIRSRCHYFRINAPTDKELIELIARISFSESIKINFNDYNEIIRISNRNIKKVFWMLEFKKLNESYKTSYDDTIQEIVNYLLTYDIKSILDIRELLYNIMITNISGTQIIKDIIKELYEKDIVSDECKLNFAEISAKFEHNLIRGRREIIHLEAFIAAIFFILNKYDKKENLLKLKN